MSITADLLAAAHRSLARVTGEINTAIVKKHLTRSQIERWDEEMRAQHDVFREILDSTLAPKEEAPPAKAPAKKGKKK